MKQLLTSLFLSVTLMGAGSIFAQVADQNPNFEESLVKYMRLSQDEPASLGTTVQQTYKALDWYEQREERRALRRSRNHELRMNRSYYSDYYSPYYYNSWNRWLPNVGFRTGDFWFSF